MRGINLRPQVRGNLGSASAEWTPANLSIPTYVWYKADEGVTTDGDGVAQWDDQSGNDFHLYQVTGAKKPALSTASFGGAESILFDGVDDALWSAADIFDEDLAANAPFYFFLVMDPDDDFTGFHTMFSVNNPPQYYGGLGFQSYLKNFGYNFYRYNTSSGYQTDDKVMTGQSMVVLYEGSNSWYTVNNGDQHPITVGSLLGNWTAYPRELTVGHTWGVNYPMKGHLRELGFIRDSLLTAGDLENLQAYLYTRAAL